VTAVIKLIKLSYIPSDDLNTSLGPTVATMAGIPHATIPTLRLNDGTSIPMVRTQDFDSI